MVGGKLSAAQEAAARRREWESYADPRDVALVEEWIASLPPMSEKRLDKHRGYVLKSRHLWLRKPLEDCTQQDLKAFVKQLDEAGFEPWTVHDYRQIVKKFFSWSHDQAFASVIKVVSPENTVGPEDILTESELARVFSVCNTLRDKAMSHTLYEAP